MPEADSRHTIRRRQAAFAALAEVVHPDLRSLSRQEEADRLLGHWWKADALVERLARAADSCTDAVVARDLESIIRDFFDGQP